MHDRKKLLCRSMVSSKSIMNNLSDITAVILAGGLGTRLRSVVPDRPKVLAEVHGKYFLTFLLDYLIKGD